MDCKCDDCPHLTYEDPEFRDGPVVWKCDCKDGCVKERKEEEE